MATATMQLRDVMTANPLTIRSDATVAEAAEAMATADVGPIPVVNTEGEVYGMITDRDITVRVVAQHKDPETCAVADACTPEVVSCPPDATVADAARMMSENALRRLPVVDNNRVVGIVSLGDLALEGDSQVDDVLTDISAAPPNS
jgi:CBS domain-containing protein